MKFVFLLWFLYTTIFSNTLAVDYPKVGKYSLNKDVDEPLFLTTYLEERRREEGREAAKVRLDGTNVTSYSGFFTVNSTYNSNMFFWFFPSETDPENAPVVVWLQGGPGGSSLYGLFCENGPFFIDKEGSLTARQYYWTKVLNVIYIDNPVGTGFSFTDSDDGYATNEADVGRDLYSALSQFFYLFPELRKNDFFVTGESYAGKYVPAVSFAIHSNNQKGYPKINLKGMAIGDGLTDPETMMRGYGDYLYHIGLIDSRAQSVFQQIEDEIVENIKMKNYLKAFEGFDSLLNGDLTPYKSLFYNQTGFHFYFNFLNPDQESPYSDPGEYLQRNSTRKGIHVGHLPYHTDTTVELHLKNDMMQSVKPWVQVLLENYKVLFYSGQLDIIVPYLHTVNFLKSLNWSGAKQYQTAARKLWYVDGELAGYAKSVKGLTEVLVRNAGHMVPSDQPKWAYDLITRFIFNKPF